MPDLYGWIVERLVAMERQVRDQESTMWQIYLGGDSLAQVVFRRCAADRKLLEVHKPRGGEWDPYVCEGCGQAGYCQDWVTENANDCPVLLAVAEGYGLTEEILAGLDRPEWKPPRPTVPSVLGKAAEQLWKAALLSSVKDNLVLSSEVQPEPSPREKALRILEPELRAIPLYRPANGT